MICSSCNKTYPASGAELGQVKSLSGLCEDCGNEPEFKPFARSFIGGAISGALSMEIFVLLLFLDDWRYSVLLPLVVAAICAAVYLFSIRSPTVRYLNEEQRKSETLGQRVFGSVVGFVVGFGIFLVFVVSRM